MVYQNYQNVKRAYGEAFGKKYNLPAADLRPFRGMCGLLFVLLVSCATSPSAPKPETFYSGRSGFALMPEGAELYMTAEVQKVRPILDSLSLGGMTGSELERFLDMSDTLTAAVFKSVEVWHFYGAASGKFPNATGGLFFSASKDWEKKVSASGIPYWYSDNSKLAVSLGDKNAYFSDTDPFVPPPGTTVPEALPAMRTGSVLSGWMNNPGEALGKVVAGFGVPISIPAERLVFAVFPADGQGQYTATLRFETPTSTQAAALARIFTLAKLGMAMANFDDANMKILAEAFFSQTPQAEGSALIVRTGKMSGKDIALLFNSISVQ